MRQAFLPLSLSLLLLVVAPLRAEEPEGSEPEAPAGASPTSGPVPAPAAASSAASSSAATKAAAQPPAPPAIGPDGNLTPFGDGLVVGTPKPPKALAPASFPVDCLSPDKVALWKAELAKSGQDAPFVIEQEGGKGVLRVFTARCEPARTTVRVNLPGDAQANGAVWAKGLANYVTFRCKSDKPAAMTFHLLQKGKSPGTYQSGFLAKPGEWQTVVLPLALFGVKGASAIAGFGIRTADAPGAQAATVSIADIAVGTMPYNDDSWKGRAVSVSLEGDWRFALDADGDKGMKEKWYGPAFDDKAWAILKSGQAWQQQGIDGAGYGWYRQKLFVPKECEGMPLALTLGTIPSDDDVWVNGTRVGGFDGEYKYSNWLTRVYTVPASLLRYGEANTIAVRVWGGDITFIGNKSGLAKGPFSADFDPYGTRARVPGGEAFPLDLFDLSDARQGKPFELLFALPPEVAKDPGAQLSYHLSDLLGNEFASGKVALAVSADGKTAEAVVPIDRETAQAVYLRGRFQALLLVDGPSGGVYAGLRKFIHLSFAKRDQTALPALAETTEETPYGKLRLVDEIDASSPEADDPHPYLQSGFSHAQERMTPGAPVDVRVSEILGRKARESGYGWFAYRIGRGKLKPHSMYLVRIEYPEDKARFAPVEIQTGQNFMDVGWKNGVGPDDVYDNWPLSKKWQWYDVIVPLDDTTTGTGGVGTAQAENGFWLYFLNKVKAESYYAMFEGGPAIGRIKLYEIDPDKNAPVIQRPKGLPNRTLSFDWERQPDHDPIDFVRYAKLMGYSAISPVVIKWAFANYTEPLNGYMSVNTDRQNYWAKKAYDPEEGKDAAPAVPGKPTIHARYLEATKQYGIEYIPRFEWGGSLDLPKGARAVAVDGQPAKPNRFAPWCTDLLDPLAWDDLKKLMDHMVKPYVKENPQLTGVLWRIRCNRLPISYSKADLELFSKETGTALPPGGEAQWAAWAAGDMKAKYDDWWHEKREKFHARLVELLRSYRPDLNLYYYNWDEDKFGLIEPDITAWGFVSNVVKPLPEGGRAAYEKERQTRKSFTAQDYLAVMRSGNFGKASKGTNRADYGIRPDLYKDVKGMQIFAPANYLCYANLPEYLEYFRMPDGLAVSNVVSYDEVGSRTINPKYEGNMITPAGGPFSMALELLPYFHADARTLNYTVYTYGRGFADAHRRFAQAFLALPAIPGTVVDQGDKDLKVRTYPSESGTYVGVAFKGYEGKKLSVKVPAKAGTKVVNLVTNAVVPSKVSGDGVVFEIESGPMELNAYLVQ